MEGSYIVYFVRSCMITVRKKDNESLMFQHVLSKNR